MKRILAAVVLAANVCAADEFAGYEKRIVTEAKELKAFENPDFEDSTKYGKVDEHAEIGRFGFNGNGGIRIRPFDKRVAHGFPLLVKLEKGKRYVYSADCRTHGEINFQIAVDGNNVKTKKYTFGAWGPAHKPIGDGWEHYEVEVLPKDDPENMNYKFMAFCLVPTGAKDAKSPENYVDVDNIAVREDVPKWYFCNTWPTHNWLFSEEGRIRCHNSFMGEFLAKDAEAAYALELTAADGRRLARQVLSPDANGNLTAAFGKIDYEGPAKLSATLYDRTHRLELGTRSVDVTVRSTYRPKPGELFVKENGVVLRDGKPFMPLGFYTGLAYRDKVSPAQLEEHLKKLHDAGFNAMIDYGTYTLTTKETRDLYYGLCEKYGVFVLPDDFKACGPAINRVDEDMEGYRRIAEDLAGRKAVIGFYNMDEGAESYVAPLTKLRRMINELMPGKLVNICNIMRPAPYLPAADIQGGDSYPISSQPTASLGVTDSRLREMRACAPATIWYAPQAYNWAGMKRGAMNDPELYRKSGREPTENETLAVALVNVANGVTGFFFYSYFDVFRCPIKEWIPKRWDAVCSAGRILRELEPFIMSGEPIIEIEHTDRKDRTRVVALSDGKGGRRVIVYGLGRDHDATFTLPTGFGPLKPRCGIATESDGTYSFKAKEFACDLLQ